MRSENKGNDCKLKKPLIVGQILRKFIGNSMKNLQYDAGV